MHYALCSALLLCISCVRQEETVDRSEGYKLYLDQKKILTAYIDTLQHSTDTLSLLNIPANLEAALAKSAYSHAPDADHLLTIAQQDTLQQLTRQYLMLLHKRVPDAALMARNSADQDSENEDNPEEKDNPKEKEDSEEELE